jgi:oligoendopeptidase F
MDQSQKAELVISALQQRIGEIVTEYETKIAIYRAEITLLQDANIQKAMASEEYSNQLQNLARENKEV